MSEDETQKPSLPDTVDWPAETQQWFEAWRGSRSTDSWTPLQWSYLVDTALVHAEVWGSMNTAMLGELHRREAYMGVAFGAAQDRDERSAEVTKLAIIQGRAADRLARAKDKDRTA